MIDPYHVTFARDSLSLSMTQWGTVVSITTLLSCIANLLAANPSDSQGRVKFVLVSMISFPITYFLFLNSGNYLQLMLARMAVTIGSGIGQHRGRYNALLEIAWSVLYGGGNWIGGVLYQNVGLRAPYNWSIGLMAVGAILSVLFLREPKVKAE